MHVPGEQRCDTYVRCQGHGVRRVSEHPPTVISMIAECTREASRVVGAEVDPDDGDVPYPRGYHPQFVD
jgi:hypothetical protein